jgi:hypothetical protein
MLVVVLVVVRTPTAAAAAHDHDHHHDDHNYDDHDDDNDAAATSTAAADHYDIDDHDDHYDYNHDDDHNLDAASGPHRVEATAAAETPRESERHDRALRRRFFHVDDQIEDRNPGHGRIDKEESFHHRQLDGLHRQCLHGRLQHDAQPQSSQGRRG